MSNSNNSQITPNNPGGNGQVHNQTNVNHPRSIQDLKDIIAKMDPSLERLLKYAFVLLNLDYYFQGIILTAVSQVESPQGHLWLLFSALSLVPFFLNALPLIHVANKYIEVKLEQDKYKLELQRSIDDAQNNQQQQQQVNNQQQQGNNQQQVDNEDRFRKCLYISGRTVAVVVWFTFHGLVLWVCYSLLSRKDPVRPAVDYDGNCFSLCDDNKNKCMKICT